MSSSSLRTQSLLAWLAAFAEDEGRPRTLQQALAHDEISIALVSLRDGVLLFHVLDQLHEGALSASLSSSSPNQAGHSLEWAHLSTALSQCLSSSSLIKARLHEAASSSSSNLFGRDEEEATTLLPLVLEAFLGTAVGPTVPQRANSIHQILSLPPDHQEQLKVVIEEQMEALAAAPSTTDDEDINHQYQDETGLEQGEESEMPASTFEGEEERPTELEIPPSSSAADHQAGSNSSRGDRSTRSRRGEQEGFDAAEDDEEEVGGDSPASHLSATNSKRRQRGDKEEGGEGAGKRKNEEEEAADHQQVLNICRARIQELELENEDLKRREQGAAEREQAVRSEVEGMRQSLLSYSLSGEVQAMERESSYKEQVADLNRKLSNAEKRLAGLEGAGAKIEKLQDEVDVLRPAARKLESAEDALSKVRAKLQDLQDVKERLLQEQAAHAEVLETSLKQERELQQLPPLRRQLETYKTGATDNELALRELRASQQECEQDNKELKQELSTIKEALAMAQTREQDMHHQMDAAATSEGGESEMGGGGIGGGLSECNPEVMKRMRALEEEVENLRAQVFATSITRVEALEGQLDDQRRLAQKIEEMYRKTKSESATRTEELKEAEIHVASLQQEIQSLQGKIMLMEEEAVIQARQAKEAEGLAMEERETLWAGLREAKEALAMSHVELEQRVYHQGRLAKRAHAKAQAYSRLASMGMQALVRQLSHDAEGLAGQLRDSQEQYAAEKRTREAAEHCVLIIKKESEEAAQVAQEALLKERAHGEQRLRELYNQAQAAFVEKEREFSHRLSQADAKLREYTSAHAVSNEEHHAEMISLKRALEVARQEAACLCDETEQQKMIQCRLEREKKFLTEEAQSLRKELNLRQQKQGEPGGGQQAQPARGLTGKRGTAGATTAGGTAAIDNNLLGIQFEELKAEYQALLKEHQRQQAGIRLAEHGIGFSLSDFSPEDIDLPEKEYDEEVYEEEDAAEMGGRGGGLQRDFEAVSTTPHAHDGRGGPNRAIGGASRRRTAAVVGGGQGKAGGSRNLRTPPKRIPMMPPAEGYQAHLEQLVHKNRSLVLERTSAIADKHKLEGELATLKNSMSSKDDEIGSLKYHLARLNRQLDNLTSSSTTLLTNKENPSSSSQGKGRLVGPGMTSPSSLRTRPAVSMTTVLHPINDSRGAGGGGRGPSHHQQHHYM